ncbi:class I SAM-dependent methyltransferase [Mesorhizobium australicum]|uniref:class I SAM-dependent methyltransferase n=1 Tax=Mesorhizobium australicum TaxID=536018 RepID=UPI0033351395
MNRGNAGLNYYALQQLELAPRDTVLEVGFGGGVLLPMLMARAAVVHGVDRSADVVAAARRKFNREVRSGKASFDKVPLNACPSPTLQSRRSAFTPSTSGAVSKMACCNSRG